MSHSAITTPDSPPPALGRPARGFVFHAKLISLLTFLSRIFGLIREALTAQFFGAGPVSSAFAVAFTIPNLFRRLFGEGALSAAFIPLYSKALKEQKQDEARRFAAASVKLLVILLVVITVVGEAILWGAAALLDLKHDRLLAIQLAAIMLPYVLLVCCAAFLGSILQVHQRFGLTAASPIILNCFLIVGTIIGAMAWDLDTQSGQTRAVIFIAFGVIIAGAIQVAILFPSLRAIGFGFDFKQTFWSPQVKRMLKLSAPVFIGAGVLQLSVLLDRGISFLLAQRIDSARNVITHFDLFGMSIRYPLESGAAARLAWAQYLYQFPLGVFAIALATAIFPKLSSDALNADRGEFRASLQRGFAVTLWEGLPASLGLIIVAQPAVQVLFERGRFNSHDTLLMAGSVRIYAAAIWAFSMQQIISRAYYALHDTKTPLVVSIVTLMVNLAVEVPLMWPLGEAGLAAGTTASFILQTLIMLWMLRNKCGGSLGLRAMKGLVLKIVIATALMGMACWGVQNTPIYPNEPTRSAALVRLVVLLATGGASYAAACWGMGVFRELRRAK